MTRSRALLEALDEEEKFLRETERRVASQVENMGKVFEKMTITVDTHTVPVMKCMELMMVMKSQRDQMANFLQGFNIKDLGLPSLASARENLITSFKEAVGVWSSKLDAIVALMGSIMMEDSASSLFESVWLRKAVTLRLVWNQKDQCFDLPTGIEPAGELHEFIKQASRHFGGAPNGTVFVVNASSTDGGQTVNFKTRIDPPPGYSAYYGSNSTT